MIYAPLRLTFAGPPPTSVESSPLAMLPPAPPGALCAREPMPLLCLPGVLGKTPFGSSTSPSGGAGSEREEDDDDRCFSSHRMASERAELRSRRRRSTSFLRDSASCLELWLSASLAALPYPGGGHQESKENKLHKAAGQLQVGRLGACAGKALTEKMRQLGGPEGGGAVGPCLYVMPLCVRGNTLGMKEGGGRNGPCEDQAGHNMTEDLTSRGADSRCRPRAPSPAP